MAPNLRSITEQLELIDTELTRVKDLLSHVWADVVEMTEAAQPTTLKAARHYANGRSGAGLGRKVTISGPLRNSDVHESMMDEFLIALEEGTALTSRELVAQSATTRYRYNGIAHQVAAVTGHMRRYGPDLGIVEAPHPSGSRRAIAWRIQKASHK